MKRSVTVALVVLSAALASGASAQVPTRDSVIGSGVVRTSGSDSTYDFQIEARSGPRGENPTGTVTFTNSDGSTFFNGPVTCLAVNANFGILNVNTPQYHAVGMEVTDLPTGDLIRAIPTTTSACTSIGPAVSFDVISGDVTVTDATPPPTYADCRQGGWVQYGYSGRAQCVAAVHDYARDKCLFERAFIGVGPFREKYGQGPNHDYAMRRCIRRYTGF